MKENYPENIVESCGDLIFALDGEGVVKYINRKIEEFGYCRDEIIGKRFSSFVILDSKRDDPFRPEEGAIQSISRFKLREKSGEIREVEINLSPLKDGQGRVIGLSGIARDIAPRIRFGDPETRLSPGFAHDAKSPLAALKLSLSILEKSAGEDDLPILKIMDGKLAQLQKVMLKLLDLIPVDRE
jgi:PAS domain S-box-containing protein